MNRKGQAAMEFLMTYGWAILVVLVAIAALAHFGVTDQTNRIPQACFFQAGMDCIDTAMIDSATDKVTFVLINNLGSAIDVINITNDVNDDCGSPSLMACVGDMACTPAALPVRAGNNVRIKMEVTCGDIKQGRFKVNPLIVYSNTLSGLSNTASGQITGKAS